MKNKKIREKFSCFAIFSSVNEGLGNLLFPLTLQTVRINNPGVPLLGLAKAIYYSMNQKIGKIGGFLKQRGGIGMTPKNRNK